MAKINLISVRGNAANLGGGTSTAYFLLGGSALSVIDLSAPGPQVACPFRTVGTLSGLSVRISPNTNVTNSWICTLGCVDSGSFVAGNQTVTIPAGGTGTYEDNTNTDTVTPIDANTPTRWVLRVTRVGGASVGNTTFVSVGVAYDTGGNTQHFRQASTSGISTSSAGYEPICGASSGWSTSVTPLKSVITIPEAGTIRNPGIRVDTNSRNGVVTFSIFKNGVATSLTLTIGIGATGWIHATGSVAVAAGDTISWVKVVGGTTGSVVWDSIYVEYQADTEVHVFAGGGSGTGGLPLSVGEIVYVPIAATITDDPSSTFTQVPAAVAFRATSLGVYFTNSGQSVIAALYKNGVATAINQTLTSTANQQWVFTSAQLVSISRGDLLNIRIEGVTSATLGATQLNGIPFNAPPVVNAGPDQNHEYVSTDTLYQLAGSVSDVDGPGPLTSAWTQTSGPSGGVATFTSSTSPTSTVKFSKYGTYVLRLTGNDGATTAFDEVTFTLSVPEVGIYIDQIFLNFLVETLTITAAANARDTMEVQIYRDSISGVPARNVEVIVEIEGNRHFGGILNNPVYRGFGGIGWAPINVLVQAIDFNAYLDMRVITEDIPFGVATGELIGVTNSLATNPAQVFTSVPHGLTTGDDIIIADHQYANSEGTYAYAFLALEENMVNGDTITIDTRTYTMESVFTDTVDKILIGASPAATAANITAAINAGTGAGTVYGTGTTAHATTNAIVVGDGVKVQADAIGTAGNSIAVAETHTGDLIRWFTEGNITTTTLTLGSNAITGSTGAHAINGARVATVTGPNSLTVPVNSAQAGYGGTLRKAFVLKDLITDALTYVADKGITLSGSQLDGPSVAGRKNTYQTVKEFMDSLSDETGWIHEVDYFKVFKFWEPGTVDAPFNIADNDGNVLNARDLTVEYEHDYANNIVLIAGGDGAGEVVTDEVVEDGTAPAIGTLKQYQFRYQAWDDYQGEWPNVLMISGVNFGPVNYGMPNEYFAWGWDHLTHSLWHDEAMTPRPSTGATIAATYRSRYPIVVILPDAAEIAAHPAGQIDKKIIDDSIKTIDVANARAAEELANAVEQPRTVRYTSEVFGLKPGQKQHITSPIRNIDADFLIVEVVTANDESEELRYQVTAVEGVKFRGTWRDIYKNWNR